MKPWERLDDVVEVVTSSVIEEFLTRFRDSKQKCITLWLISPWITPLEGEAVPLRELVDALEREGTPTIVITRLPSEPYYEQALKMLGKVRNCEILIMNHLHAKLYISYNRGESFAMIGSANMSAHSRFAVEIGLLIKDYAWGANLIHELLGAASIIRSQPHHRVKSMGKAFNEHLYGDLVEELL